MAILNGHEVAFSKPSFNTRNGTLDIAENGEYEVETYEKVAVEVSGGLSGGYTVTFKVENDVYYIASCQQGESITEPPVSSDNFFHKWKDENDNDISFPYTPNADIELYGTALYNADLLLHCDSFLDSGKHDLAVTNNGVDINTSVKKFGTGSFHFSENTDYIEIPNTYFAFATNDFTIDFWFYPTAFTGAIINSWGASNGWSFYIEATKNTNGQFLMAFSTTGTNSGYQSKTISNFFVLNVWQHIAITRSGNNIYIYYNGVLKSTWNIGTAAFSIPINPVKIGLHSSDNNYYTTGYIDELRIMNGTCAWTENFTPPTAPY